MNIANKARGTFNGTAGNDILLGTVGPDDLIGGAGNDVYRIDDPGDRIFENAGAGDDTLFSSISYTLAAGVSVETMGTTDGDGTGVIDLTGNDSGQSLYCNAGGNVLRGGGGADSLNGLAGNDVLIGDGGSDVLRGGAGNDVYRIEDAGDLVFENDGEGDDTLYAGLSHVLAAGVSVETMGTTDGAGTAAIDLTGNELGNSLYGNAGANVLSGGGGADHLVGLDGDDVLIGGGGADVLRGGAGFDEFRFDTSPHANNIDQIIDFVAAEDLIRLVDVAFPGLGNGTLQATAFHTGSSAHDASDRIIYDSSTGALYFDSDGNGAGAAVQFASIAAGLSLSHTSFLVGTSDSGPWDY